MRKKSAQVELRVLLRNKRTCCICHDSDKEVQIHHIDGNSNNTLEQNLAILCLSHHSQATAGLRKGASGLGRKLTPDEVRAHKKAWELKATAELKVRKESIRKYKRSQLRSLYEFEINKIKNEILSAKNNAKDEVNRKLEFLGQLTIEEIISDIPLRKMILDAFADIAVQSAGSNFPSLQLLKTLPRLYWHLIGPEHVKMLSEDQKVLLSSLDILDTLTGYGASLSEDSTLLRKAGKTVVELAQTASVYEFQPAIRKAKKVIMDAKKELKDYRSSEGRLRQTKRIRRERGRIIDDYLRELSKL